MRRYLYAFLAFIVFAATAAYATTATGIAPPTASSVVKVLPAKGHGSGVHVGGGYIVTAAHVAEDAKYLTIKTSDGKTRSADVLWVNKAYDVALLRTDAAGMASSKLSCATVAVGEPIRASGNPTVVEFVDAYGKVSGAPRQFGPWKSVIITNIATVPGMSGGPVFSTDGQVVGITVGVLTLPTGFSVSLTGFGTMVPSTAVCELLGRSA